MAPTPLTSPGFTHIGYHLGRGTSRHVSVEETQRNKLPKQLRLEMTHHLLLGGNVQEVSSGTRNLRDSIQRIFSYVGTVVRKVTGIFGPGVVIASTKMEQKPVFEKPENKGIKSNRPTYARAWPRRIILRCITAAAPSFAKRGPHTAASYGWSPNFLLVTITYIYMDTWCY